MLKKSIKYTDYNGVEREDTHYFNLSKAEIMEMELSTVGGFTEMVEKVIAAQDTPTIVAIFKDLILKAYGEKSPDGKGFMKLDEEGRPLSRKFSQTLKQRPHLLTVFFLPTLQKKPEKKIFSLALNYYEHTGGISNASNYNTGFTSW